MPDPRQLLDGAEGGRSSRDLLAPRMIAALRAVLARHEPVEHDRDGRLLSLCPECYAEAPCDTVRAITTALQGDDDAC